MKLSVVGVGMRSHAGVAQRMFQALAEKGINIQVISTSEIKVSVLVAEEYTELALACAAHRLRSRRGVIQPAPNALVAELRPEVQRYGAATRSLDRLWARGREFLGTEIAIMGGGMTWVSERGLVAAISNAGGFGVIACGAMDPMTVWPSRNRSHRRADR